IINETSSIRTDPKISFLIFGKCVNIIERKTGIVNRVVPVQGKPDDVLVIITYSAFERSQPDNAGIVAINCVDTVLYETAVIFRRMQNVTYRPAFLINNVDSAVISCNPYDVIICRHY